MSAAAPPRWQFWIDRGGTFTDIVGSAPTARWRRRSCCPRTRSSIATPPSPASAACSDSRRRRRSLPPRSSAVKMGTTVATNALLERKGEPTLLVIDARLSRRAAHRLPGPAAAVRAPASSCPSCSTTRVVEVDERMSASTARWCARSTNAALARDLARRVRDRASAASPSCFMHGWRYTAHELAAERIARATGFTQVSVSHTRQPADEAGRRAATPRWSTPISRRSCAAMSTRSRPRCRACELLLHAVVGRPGRGARASRARTRSCRGRPAASSAWCGPRSSRLTARLRLQIIGFDMGGTSTDVSHYAGEFERAFETEVAGVRMRAPMMAIHTVAAGGGSILQLRRRALSRRPARAPARTRGRRAIAAAGR